MSISFVFILNMIFVSYVQSDIPQLMCGYAGADGIFHYEIEVSEIPPRCTDIYYGGYYFNQTPIAQVAIDIANIKKANKPVWLFFLCQDPKELSTLVCSKDPSALDKYLALMVNYIKDNKVDGVVLDFLGLQDGKIPDYTNVVVALINKIKKCVPSIKIGLCPFSSDSDKFANKKIFDFTATNSIVDFYIFETSTVIADCTVDSNAKGGKLPNSTLEKMWTDICSSPMDQSKLMALALDYTSNSNDSLTTYSAYCARKDSNLWCADSIKNVYNQVEFYKKHFKGIAIAYLDSDDFNNSCGCGQFPVANAMMDAWEGKEMPTCANLC